MATFNKVSTWLIVFSVSLCALSCAHKEPLKIEPPITLEEERTLSPKKLPTSHVETSDPIDTAIEEKLKSLSLEEKIGQLLVIGFSGKSLSSKTQILLNQIKPGSVILFSRNIGTYKQLRKFTEQLQATSQTYSKLPMLIMVDQEGGVVTRVKVGTSLPSALALAQTRHPQFIRSYSRTMGRLLNHLGINMNLAPVLDVSNPNEASFIGSRSFGRSPEEVSRLGVSFAQGQWDAGIIPTAKHFPGHGGLKTDSHKVTPLKNQTLNELIESDVKPFKAYTNLQFPTAMMLGHVGFPKIDQTGFPAAFSKKLNHDLLREYLNYDGLTITDDLEMAGAEKVGSISDRTIQAVLAGNDMIMVAWSEKRQLQAYNTLLKAVRSGGISEERINQSVKRILRAKKLVENKSLDYDLKEVEQSRKKLVELSKDVKRLSFQSALRRAPFSSQALPTLGESIFVYSSDKTFFNYFKKTYLKTSQWIPLSKKNVKAKIHELNLRPTKTPFIFYVSGTGTARWLDRLTTENKRNAIVINSNQPGAIRNSKDFLKVVHINSTSPESGAWLADYLNKLDPLRIPTGDYVESEYDENSAL